METLTSLYGDNVVILEIESDVIEGKWEVMKK